MMNSSIGALIIYDETILYFITMKELSLKLAVTMEITLFLMLTISSMRIVSHVQLKIKLTTLII